MADEENQEEEVLTEEEVKENEVEAAEFSNDQLVRAQTIEITDDMPDEVKQQLKQFNEMSEMLNKSIDTPVEFEKEDLDEEDGEDGEDEESATEDSAPAQSFAEDKNVEYSDIF